MHNWQSIAVGTTQAQTMLTEWKLFAIVGAAVGVLVAGLLFFCLIRFRRRIGAAEPRQFRNQAVIEILWTIAPLALVCALFVHTYTSEQSVEALAAEPDTTIAVTAYRWGWNFQYWHGPLVTSYPHEAGTNHALTAATEVADLRLPVNQTTRIRLTSLDVTHSFWIPNFLFKRDAIPGVVNEFDLHPTRTGTFLGRCAQFCGLDHARMTFRVDVLTPTEYSNWLHEARSPQKGSS
jgi:cytochrome c oxidase subunit 2